MGWLDHMLNTCLAFKKLPKCFSKVVVLFYIPISHAWEFQLPHIFAKPWYDYSFYFSHSTSYVMISHCDWTCLFLVTNTIEYLSDYLFTINTWWRVCQMLCFFFFFLAAKSGIRDLSSLIRHGTCDPRQWKHRVLTTRPPGKSLAHFYWIASFLFQKKNVFIWLCQV